MVRFADRRGYLEVQNWSEDWRKIMWERVSGSERERERERETASQPDRQRQRQRASKRRRDSPDKTSAERSSGVKS